MFKRVLATAAAVVTLGFGGIAAAANANASTSLEPVHSDYVVNQFSGKCLDNSGFRWADGNPLQQWTCGASGGQDQHFQLVEVGNNEYLAAVAPDGTFWYVTPAGFRGQLVIENSLDSNGDQVVAVRNGYYSFINTGGALVMDDKGFSKSNGSPVIGYFFNGGSNQQWTELRQPRVPGLSVFKTESVNGGAFTTGSVSLQNDKTASDTLEYHVFVKNTGNVKLYDVKVQDSPNYSFVSTNPSAAGKPTDDGVLPALSFTCDVNGNPELNGHVTLLPRQTVECVTSFSADQSQLVTDEGVVSNANNNVSSVTISNQAFASANYIQDSTFGNVGPVQSNMVTVTDNFSPAV